MTTLAKPGRLLLSRAEVAEMTGLSTSTIDREISSGALPALKLGPGQRVVRVRREDLAAWIHRAHPEEGHDAA